MPERGLDTVVSCPAPLGHGGVGRHAAEVVAHVRGSGRLARYYAPAVASGDPVGVAVSSPALGPLLRYSPARFHRGWATFLSGDLFDRAVARHLREAPGSLVAFSGAALHTFRRARALGCERLELVALNNHPDAVLRQHARAYADWPLERGWMSAAQAAKQRREYAEADLIHVSSAHLASTLIEAGVPEHKLRPLPLAADARFRPAETLPSDDRFRVVYVGSLSVTKGTPVLLEAFHLLNDPKAELVLVGGWGTRGMRRYVEAALARDHRVHVSPGDPLPHLHRASVLVHPSYDDAFGYAPVEALACGVPVVVTEHTGMKERVREGANGYVVPTGDRGAVVERLTVLHGLVRSTCEGVTA